MNNYQTNIIWLGLILIVLNLVVNLSTFKSVVFNQNGSSTPNQNPPLAPGQFPVQPTPPKAVV